MVSCCKLHIANVLTTRQMLNRRTWLKGLFKTSSAVQMGSVRKFKILVQF